MQGQNNFLGKSRGIILAADVIQVERLRGLSELASQFPEVCAIKVGFSLGLRYGLPTVVSAIREVCETPIIYDHQKAATDIPAMGKLFAETCKQAGVDGVIFFPQAGPRTLEAFIDSAIEAELTPIVGLVMTHPAYLESDGGFIVDSAPGTICEIALKMGVRNFVLPGNNSIQIRKFAQGPLSQSKPLGIMMPGIGTQGGSIASAFDAASGHFTFAIIGSAIYDAYDPKATLRRFIAEISR